MSVSMRYSIRWLIPAAQIRLRRRRGFQNTFHPTPNAVRFPPGLFVRIAAGAAPVQVELDEHRRWHLRFLAEGRDYVLRRETRPSDPTRICASRRWSGWDGC